MRLAAERTLASYVVRVGEALKTLEKQSAVERVGIRVELVKLERAALSMPFWDFYDRHGQSIRDLAESAELTVKAVDCRPVLHWAQRAS